MANWTYTTILHEPRKLLRISVLEYTVLDVIYQSQVSPKYGLNGWAKNGCHQLAEFMGCSPATILGVFDRMEKMGYLEFHENRSFKRTSESFYGVAYEKDHGILSEIEGCSKTERVQKLNGWCSETEQSGVQKLNGWCSETEHKYKRKGKDNIKQKKADLSKIEIVKEVIDYLNTQAKTSFKATTKETMQFVLARQKVDGWELEDFKLVIDFKIHDWGKDDRMKQYICPSTLFRASNAEKYMQAAKAWKEGSKAGQNGQIKPGVVPLFRQDAFSNPDKSKFKF